MAIVMINSKFLYLIIYPIRSGLHSCDDESHLSNYSFQSSLCGLNEFMASFGL